MRPLDDTELQARRARIAQQAGAWDARLRSPRCTDVDRRRASAWFAEDPAHQAAFDRLQAILSSLRRHQTGRKLQRLRSIATSYSGTRSSRWLSGGVAASLVVLGVCLASLHTADNRVQRPAVPLARPFIATAVYETGIGQRSIFVLEDGSTLELDAMSRASATFTSRRRSVELKSGRAFFVVAKDQGRPFVVGAGAHQITAIGTQFDVRLDTEAFALTLIEGTVRVATRSADGERSGDGEPVHGLDGLGLLVSAGKQLVARPASADCSSTPASLCTLRTVDVSRAAGWRQGRVVIEDLALADAVQEMNRYSPVQIVLGDSALARVRVNGVFRVGAQEAFVRALGQYFDIAATRRGDREIVLHSGSGGRVASDSPRT